MNAQCDDAALLQQAGTVRSSPQRALATVYHRVVNLNRLNQAVKHDKLLHVRAGTIDVSSMRQVLCYLCLRNPRCFL
jgi:hypothetical protein